MQYDDQCYLNYDPFAGDRDTNVKCLTVKLVNVREDRPCYMGMCPPAKPHQIKRGETARCERAIVEGEWCSYYVCVPCMDSWLKECGVKPLNDKLSDAGGQAPPHRKKT